MRNLLSEVIELQHHWSSKNTDQMKRRGIAIRRELPVALQDIAPGLAMAAGLTPADLGFEGSDGTGRKTEIPWVRFFSMARSPNAREGWYCVYLFHAMGDGVYLCLGHGSTVYEGGEFVPRAPSELAALVGWAKHVLDGRLASMKNVKLAISLGARTSDLGPAYENGTAAAIWRRPPAFE